MIAVEHELRPGDPTGVAFGRALVAEALAASTGPGARPARVSPAVLDDAVLAVSELVTNALVVARDRICVTVEFVDDLTRVAVYDDGPGDPVARPSTPDRVHGRGLSIVEIVAARWGVSPEPPGKWVWAEFPVALPA